MATNFYDDIGGVETVVKSLIKSYKERGLEVIVFTHYRPHIPSHEVIDGVAVYRFYGYRVANTGWVPSFGHCIPMKRYLKKHRINTIHVHSSYSYVGHAAMMVAYIMNIPNRIYTEHSLNPTTDNFTNNYMRRTATLATHITIPSPVILENLCLRALITPNSVSIVPNPLSSLPFKSTSPTRKLKIGFFGRLTHKKGADLLLTIIPAISERMSVSFHIFGEGPFKEELKVLPILFPFIELTVDSFVFGDEMVSILHELDVVLSLSTSESFGIFILEALSSGVHVISTPTGVISCNEGLRHSEQVHFVPFRPSINDLVLVLKECYEATKPAASSIIKAQFSPEHCADSFLSLYSQHRHIRRIPRRAFKYLYFALTILFMRFILLISFL